VVFLVIKIIGIMYFLGITCVLFALAVNYRRLVNMQTGYRTGVLVLATISCIIAPLTFSFYVWYIISWVMDHVRSEK